MGRKKEENPETFKVAKPEKVKSRTPKFVKILFGLIIILAIIFVVWEVYQIEHIEQDEEEVILYDGETTISNTNVPAGNTLTQTFVIDDSFNLGILTQKTDDNISYKVIKEKTEYDKFYQTYGVGREFTEQDFNNFFLIVAYKENAEISFSERYSNMDYDNIVLKEESTSAKYITFLVLPRVSATDINIILKQGNKNILENEEAVLEKMKNSLDLFTAYFNKKYFAEDNLVDPKYYIVEIKLVNAKPNEFFTTDGENQEPTGEAETCWAVNIYLEKDTNYSVQVLVDIESGRFFGGYDISTVK
jgi:hypothetical protein